MIKGPSPFDTHGSRDLHLHCVASNETEVTRYTWSDECPQKDGNQCTIRPQPPWDDGKNITCTVMYRNGQSVAATFEINLNCKYLNFFPSFTFFFRECAFDEVCIRILLACQVAVIIVDLGLCSGDL